MICCLDICHQIQYRGGLKKLQLKDQGSLKTLMTKWRGCEKFSLSIKKSSGPLPGIILTDPLLSQVHNSQNFTINIVCPSFITRFSFQIYNFVLFISSRNFVSQESRLRFQMMTLTLVSSLYLERQQKKVVVGRLL